MNNKRKLENNVENSHAGSQKCSQMSKIKRVLNSFKIVRNNFSVYLTTLLASLSHKLLLWNTCIMRKVRYILKNYKKRMLKLKNNWDNSHAVSVNCSRKSKMEKVRNASKTVWIIFVIIVILTILLWMFFHDINMFDVLTNMYNLLIDMFNALTNMFNALTNMFNELINRKFILFLMVNCNININLNNSQANSAKGSIKNNLIRVLFDILKWSVEKFMLWLVLQVWP